MEDNISEMVEEELEVKEREEGCGYRFAGIMGGTDAIAMADRKKRIELYEAREDYRECISCDRCTHCLELRGFEKSGGERVKGYICLQMEKETTPFHTCNKAQLNRKRRRKVVYDLENAPLGFEEGLRKKVPVERKGYEREEDKQKVEERSPSGGYRGGSGWYRRADGDEGKKGSGEVPRSLMN